MQQKTKDGSSASRVTWETLESFARGSIQSFVQRLLEEEVTDLLGRRRSARKAPVDPEEGYRNGFGKPRQLALMGGTITLRRPRVRHLSERFESRVLPLFKRRTEEVARLLPDLYLHGLAEGDFDLALRGLLGDAAPLSASSIARLKAFWQAEFEEWSQRPLHELEVVYIWADGIYVKAGLEKDKAAILTIMGALRDGRKVVLSVKSGQRESVESWSHVLRDLRARGLPAPALAIADGHLGLWGALANVYPTTKEQRCWNHRILNVLDKIAKRLQPEATALLKKIPYAKTVEQANKLKKTFQTWCSSNGCADAANLIDRDWERMTTFFSFPKEHWKHLRTTNIVESPFATVRLRTGAAKRYKRVDHATAVIWKTLLLAERCFRKLDAPELLGEVAEGATYVNGLRVKRKHRDERLRA